MNKNNKKKVVETERAGNELQTELSYHPNRMKEENWISNYRFVHNNISPALLST